LTLHVAGITLDAPVALAPLAGITDLPFRRVVAGFGAGLVVSEMVASQQIVQGRGTARDRAELGLADGRGGALTAVQLAGRDPHWMAEAARLVAGQGARMIDINMGCPAKKVASASGSGACGSGLMREPDLALRLIEAVVAAVEVPVTLKTRLGWDAGCLNAADLAARAVGAGVAMVTIHGRTRCQFYRGTADWAAIAPVTAAVTAAGGGAVPVLANGDITCAATARAARAASGAAGVMVGRGAQGRPWRIAEIAHALAGTPAPAVPRGAARADLVAAHYEAMLGFHGTALGLRVARKHLGWYLDAAVADGAACAEAARALRRPLLTADSPAAVLGLIARAFDGPAGPLREAA